MIKPVQVFDIKVRYWSWEVVRAQEMDYANGGVLPLCDNSWTL